MATGFYLEGLVEQIEADRADHIVGQGVELRLCLKELPQLGCFLLLLSLLLLSIEFYCSLLFLTDAFYMCVVCKNNNDID